MEQQVVEFLYACTAGVGAPAGAKEGAMARCRNLEPCQVHVNKHLWAPAPRPNVVLMKINIPRREERDWLRSGIHVSYRTEERAEELRAEHEAQAKSLGRNPLAVRERRGDRTNLPESVDSGTPVFVTPLTDEEKKGLTMASIMLLIVDLAEAGFQLTGLHILDRSWKPPMRLVMEFSKGLERKPVDASSLPWLIRHLPTTFGNVDVFANPVGANGICSHTVNCGERQPDAVPHYDLRFAHGDWAAEPHQV